MPYSSHRSGFRKVYIGFGVVIFIALFNAVFAFFIMNQNKQRITRVINVINPYTQLLESFNLMVTESKMYSTNWVYLLRSIEDKKQLRILHDNRYPALKKELLSHMLLVDKKQDMDTLLFIFDRFEKLLEKEWEIMTTLLSYDDYQNPLKKFTSEDIVESEVLPRTDSIKTVLDRLIRVNRQESEVMRNGMIDSFNRLITSVIAISVGMLVMIILGMIFISKSITRPVLQMIDMVMQMGRGELPERKLKETKDVIGMMGSAVNRLSENFSKTTKFANEIEEGNLRAGFTPLGDKDILGQALIAMRESLRAYSEDMEQKVEERTREVMEKSNKLAKAYKDIRDSISYAKRIQDAMLGSHGSFIDMIRNGFIVFKPKDIVSGDFYWYFKTADGILIFATVDCTGHGVPGAFMHMIGNTFLNEIVIENGITSASKILNELRKGIIISLGQTGKTGEQKDGMDAALCVYNPFTNTLEYAGAFNPLWVIRENKNGENSEGKNIKVSGVSEDSRDIKRIFCTGDNGDSFELLEFKPDRMPLAYSENQKPFHSHWIQLKKGDTLYLFSDGYEDQFGGPNRKKFKVTRLREMLLQIHSKPMDAQKDILDKIIEEWKGSDEQTDDITVIGVRT
ncbi:MAG: SpoIIE family protein phosphatase [Bacteroidetes bacterium]|nr:SpoIIE family protein phosphatase [Bacteroidota bacterium]